MHGKLMLYIDQYGGKWYAKTVRELRQQIQGRCNKMYVDTKGGNTLHVGYVIGKLWLHAYVPYEALV